MVNLRRTELHNYHQDQAENKWGHLGNLIENIICQSDSPRQPCNWVTWYRCQINNHIIISPWGTQPPLDAPQTLVCSIFMSMNHSGILSLEIISLYQICPSVDISAFLDLLVIP